MSFNALVIDHDRSHAPILVQELVMRKILVDVEHDVEVAMRRLRYGQVPYDLVILNVSDTSLPWFPVLDRLVETCRDAGPGVTPFLLCVSNRPRDAAFQLGIEKKGGRFVLEC